MQLVLVEYVYLLYVIINFFLLCLIWCVTKYCFQPVASPQSFATSEVTCMPLPDGGGEGDEPASPDAPSPLAS